ncbi:GPW/gp25 family protein [Thiotrichales bacterium 19S3-7]|nr:GPW/gp25 family protein [Thiotrichales bacterium 19S3-7]MCF6802560.1 GPW/gp25 family protein [Thiotrichales bacterium 19S3-11]
MQGISRITGQKITDIEHVKQSIADILTTPVGSRVMLREYGSTIFMYVDQPANQMTLAKLLNSTAEAIDKWEMRVDLTQIDINLNSDGQVSIDVEFTYKPDGEDKRLNGVTV